MSGPYVRSLTIRDPEQLAEVVPGVSFRAHAPFAGPFLVDVQTVDLGDVALQLGHSGPFAGLAAATQGSAILQVPFGKIETLILNGIPLEQPGIGVYGPGAELQRSNPQENRHFSLTLPVDLVEPLLEPPSRARLFRPGRARLLRGPADVLSRAVSLVRHADRVARQDPRRFDHEQARMALRSALLQAATGLVSQAPSPGRPGLSTGPRMRIIRDADAFIRAHAGRSLYPDQVSQALGITGSALHDAFVAHFATSPYRLLQRRRLDMVRTDLTAAGGTSASVRALALARGFWNFEQFQTDYYTTFRESVAETMRTTSSNVIAFPRGPTHRQSTG